MNALGMGLVAIGTLCVHACALPMDDIEDASVERDGAADVVDAVVPDAGLATGVGCRYEFPGVVVQVLSSCDARTGEGTIVAYRTDDFKLPEDWSPDAWLPVAPWVRLDVAEAEPWGDRVVGIAFAMSEPIAAMGVFAGDGEVSAHPIFAEDDWLSMTAVASGVFGLAALEGQPAAGCPSKRVSGSHAVASEGALRELEGVTHIEGSLTIAFDDDDGLSPLSCLTTIGGSLTIRNTAGLPDVRGFANLVRVDRNLAVISNAGLAELSLPSLRFIGGTLSFDRNPALTSVQLERLVVSGAIQVASNALLGLRFERLAQMRGMLRVTLNPVLTDFIAPALLSIDGNMDFVRNAALSRVRFDALNELRGALALETNGGNATTTEFEMPALAQITRGARIRQNPRLVKLDGFQALRAVHEGLEVSNNAHLESVDGLAALTHVGGALRFAGNAVLPALVLSGLHGVEGDLEVLDHPLLTRVEFVVLREIEGRLILDANGSDEEPLSYTFDVLSSVHQEMRVRDHPSLLNLDGFAGLARVGDVLTIANNAALSEVDGWPLLASIDGPLRITSNASLSVFAADGLRSVGGNIDISRNPVLAGVRLDNLIRVDGALNLLNNGATATTAFSFASTTRVAQGATIAGNPSLRTLAGFQAVTEIGVGLTIHDNASLTELGFDGLFILGSSLDIVSNAKLPTCRAAAFQERLMQNGWAGTASIADNLADECSP